MCSWMINFGLTLLVSVVTGVFVWYEEPPKDGHPCTMHVIGRGEGDMLSAYGMPGCTEGGLRWYGVWGRIHGTVTLSLDRTQEFELCMTGGLSDTVYVWWDSHRDYWMPLAFQQWHSEVTDGVRCRPSTNGSLDMYFEPPWAKKLYVAYVSWELHPLSKERHQEIWDELEIARRPPLVYENDEVFPEADNKESAAEYPDGFVDVLMQEGCVPLAAVVVVLAAVGVGWRLKKPRAEKGDNGKAKVVRKKKK